MAQLITTADGSTSVYNATIKEGYHSASGAITESIEKFSRPLKEFVKKDTIRVLDTCFGIGYRSCAFAYVFSDKKVSITGIEIDSSLLKIMQVAKVPKEIAQTYEIFQNLSEKKLTVAKEKVRCKLIIGDLRKVVPTLKGPFDVILHDPFSPKKHPELWEKEVLGELVKKLTPQGIISTYSSARVIRDRLRDLGMTVINGPSIGRRAPSTIATKGF